MASPNTRRNSDADDNDLYTTPMEALDKLWENAPRILLNAKTISDPAFGLGDITRFFQSKGKTTIGNDLYNYGDDFSQWNDTTCYSDFLDTNKDNNVFEGSVMVMNPPFTLTSEFLDKGLEVCDNILMFNRLTTIETLKRAAKFKSKEWPLRKMFVFSGRVSCPKGVNYDKTANATAFCWFWLDKGYEGEPTITWI